MRNWTILVFIMLLIGTTVAAVGADSHPESIQGLKELLLGVQRQLDTIEAKVDPKAIKELKDRVGKIENKVEEIEKNQKLIESEKYQVVQKPILRPNAPPQIQPVRPQQVLWEQYVCPKCGRIHYRQIQPPTSVSTAPGLQT